jgi:hypothetical protein
MCRPSSSYFDYPAGKNKGQHPPPGQRISDHKVGSKAAPKRFQMAAIVKLNVAILYSGAITRLASIHFWAPAQYRNSAAMSCPSGISPDGNAYTVAP